MRVALVATVALVVGHPLLGQTVLVQVVGADTSQPLIGAIAHLVTPAGDVVSSRLSDRNGRVLFTRVASGQYRVRAEMLGHGDGESRVFGVVDGASVPLVLQLEPRAIAIEGVAVTAEAGPCESRPAQEGRLLADLWDEARKALSAAALTDREGIYRYSLLRYERSLDTDGVILDETQDRQRGYMRTPFASRAVEDLTRDGWVDRGITEWVYDAPDAQTLLSDAFLDTHCFRLVDGGADRPTLIGLAFEPTGENADLPDISGTLWIDRDSVALRWIDYTYENLQPEVRPGDATGRVEFQRMPAGTWIVPEWWIRTPLVEVDVSRSDRRTRITGFHVSGGRVIEALEAGGRDLGRGVTTGAIEGIVVDSLGMPIRGVEIGTVGSNQTLFTNAEGRFNIVNLAEGTHRVRFIDSDLAALGFEPPTVTREVVGGVSSSLEFVMATPGALLREACGTETEPGTSVLGGVVRNAVTSASIAGAMVRVQWSRLELNGASSGVVGRQAWTELSTTTDPFGVYRFCSVPRREELTVVASVDGVDGAPTRLAISSDEEVHTRTILYSPERFRAAAAPPEPPAVPAVDGARIKSGRIRDAATNAYLADALVELPDLDIRAVSDRDGHVRFQDLPEGTHVLRAERLGYERIEATLDVPGAQEFVVLLSPIQAPDVDAPGAVVGRVTDERSVGVSDVDVRVVGQPSARAITNPRGRFRIDGLDPGVLDVRFERLGHTSRTAEFVVQGGHTAELAVEMPTQAIELAPIEVTIRSPALERSGYYERAAQGFGHHFDREAIERIRPEIVYDIIDRAPGVRANDPRRAQLGAPSYAVNPRVVTLTGPPGGLGSIPPRADDETKCYMSLYIDGVRMSDPDLQQIQPVFVEAVEVYMGSDTPAQYGGNRCGAILIWTRR
jgi:hypothetical protein